ncbi:MAG: hypothetical protein WAN43_16025 [Rhodomicrobium sp.]
MALFVPVTASFSAGQSLSAATGLGENALHGILMPAIWTPANLTFQVSLDGVNYFEFYDAFGNEITVIADAGRYVQLDPAVWRAVNGVIVRSGIQLQPVVQVSATALTLMTRISY